MSELTENIRQELKDRETRVIYDDDLLNSYIATQIRTLREQRGWTQQKLAEEAGMKQERISVLEDVNYSSWTAKVLRRLAQAFDLRLTIKFEEFNTFFKDFEGVKPELLKRRSFEDDPAFKDEQAEITKPEAAFAAANAVTPKAGGTALRAVPAPASTSAGIQRGLPFDPTPLFRLVRGTQPAQGETGRGGSTQGGYTRAKAVAGGR